MTSPDSLDRIIEAVLYEGYILYPYRASSKKNRQRFTFGRIYPEAYHQDQNGAEPYAMQTQVLLRGATLQVHVRFLHPMMREIGVLENPLSTWSREGDPVFQRVSELEVNGNLYQTWQESVERRVTIQIESLDQGSKRVPFTFLPSQTQEPIWEGETRVVAVILRRQAALEGEVEIALDRIDSTTSRLTARITNRTPISVSDLTNPQEVLMRTFASAHTILQAPGGQFLSLTDPPEGYEAASVNCQNKGTWPILVGDKDAGDQDTMLSSPIILEEYPKIAPESAGTLFDGAEIDEILTLRILTMTDEEKREMRGTDECARQLLERTETLPSDHLLRMHGQMREVNPFESSFDDAMFGSNSSRIAQVSVQGVSLKVRDSVRIRPKAHADAFDMMLTGKIAAIEAIEQDAEGKIHLALVLDDDPGRDLGIMRQPGHRFFYGVDEVEPMLEVKL